MTTLRNSAKLIAVGALVAGAFVAGTQAAQPHMQAALESLRTARQSLVQASSNKAGHRANAIKLVDQAIDEVKAGIAAAE
jgi:hypothetical protein